MSKILKGVGAAIGVALVAAGGAYVWAGSAATGRLDRRFETHKVDFPVPFPLSAAELDALRAERAAAPGAPPAAPDPAAPPPDPLAGVDLAALAKERAIARGKHLVEARYACIECHGKDFGGGTMIDAPPIGRLFGMNLTGGKGGVVAKYTTADWDRTVRHGVLPDGRPTAMPAVDYFEMSDRELSDIIAYIRSVPPVDKDMPRPTLGPVGRFLMATGKLLLSAEEKKDHQAAHRAEPPAEGESVEFGKHLVGVCTGCHQASLAGGPIVGGDPSWPPAANLTPHADGLAGWTYDDFVRALREAKRKDGTAIRLPMANMTAYAARMTEVELKAMWKYLESLPPLPTPKP